MDRSFEVLIIGGGNCGLAIATGLKKAGISYTVFERDNEHDFLHKARDWGMLLHWGTEYLEKLIPDELRARIKEPRVDPACEMSDRPVPYFNGATGEIIGQVPTDVITRVSRKKLRRFLTEDQDLNIQCGKVLSEVNVDQDGVTVSFEDGSKAHGNMIIGCDGSHSKIRQFLVGVDAARCENVDLTMVNYPGGQYSPEQAKMLRNWHPIVQLSIHPQLCQRALLAALDIPDGNDSSGWRFQNYSSWWGPPYASDLQDPAARRKFIKERLCNFSDPFRTGWLNIADDAVIPIYPGQQWAPTMPWGNHSGRVTLAAHSMLPHRGQGLNNAMKDASDLVDAITATVAGKKLSEAIDAYEAEMKPRGATEVALSLEQAKDWNSSMDSPIFRYGHNRT